MEQFANFLATTVLNMPGDLNTTDVTLTLVSIALPIPQNFPFRIRIDDELMKVTATPGTNQLTVVRADGGTTAANHVDGSDVRVILTKEGLESLVSVQESGVETSNRRILNFDGDTFEVTDSSGNTRADITSRSRIGEIYTKPVVGDFTFDGHSISGTPTAVQQGASIYMYHPGTNGDTNTELYITPPATPYSVVAKLIPFALPWSFTSPGLYFGDGTKLFRLVWQYGNNHITVDKYTAYNSFSGNLFDLGASVFNYFHWFKIADDGSNKRFSISADGINWLEVASEGSTSFLSSTTRIGVCLNGNTGQNNTGRVVGLIVESWKVNV